MNRTLLTLAVLTAAGLAATGTGRNAVDSLIPPASAQQANEPERRSSEARQSGEEQGEESQIARAADDSSSMIVESLSIQRSEEYGEYLADGRGRALYLLESESDGESMCYERCAERWPPATVRGGQLPEIQGGVERDLLGTTQRRDGGTQLTYGNYPLYYYHRDSDPGDIRGQAVDDRWGAWYLVTPDGRPLEEETAENAEGEQN